MTTAEAEDLLTLALSRPADAFAAARNMLADRPDPYYASIARQVVGIVLRDRGQLADAVRELRRALASARASGHAGREADVRATLGTALAWSGRTRQGLTQLDAASSGARGSPAGRILLRRAAVLISMGSYDAALEDLNAALPLLRESGDVVWRARVLTRRAEIQLVRGATGRATADYALAEELFREAGQEFEFAMARQNRGMAALVQGDLPRALQHLDEAARRYEKLGTTPPDLASDRCSVLLAAGMAGEAMDEADAARRSMHRHHGLLYKQAELLHLGAVAALALPDLPGAIERASRARRLFRAQRRDLWLARTELVLAHARYAGGRRSTTLFEQARSVGQRLERLDREQAQRAHLLTGRIAVDLGRADDARQHLERAARARRAGPPLARSLGWLARALLAQSRGDRRGTLSACRAGLAALDQHLSLLGSTELHAYATAHGRELATIALHQTMARGDAWQFLAASERWRATTLGLRSTTASADSDLAQSLAALRTVTRQLERNRASGNTIQLLQRERRRLEATIRQRVMQTSGTGTLRNDRLDPRDLGDTLGPTRVAVLVEAAGRLQVLTIAGRRIRRHERAELPVADVEHARFLLRRLAYGPPRWTAPDLLDDIGRRLQDVLLGPAVDDLGVEEPIVVVPPSTLHAVPWSMLPAFRQRSVSVSPSVSTLLNARRLTPPERRVSFVVGPGLGSGASEVGRIALQYPDATVLQGGAATAEAALSALDGAWLAHVAAHGSFRSDNPLFSALHVDDGPLTVHDLEQLRRAPYRLLLPCCDSGVGAPTGSDELLGLVSSLLQLGAAGILATVVRVNDAATVPLMVAVHEALRSGADLPEALCQARLSGDNDLVSRATGHSFVAFGI